MTPAELDALDERALRLVDLVNYVDDPGCARELSELISATRRTIATPGITWANADGAVRVLEARGTAILGGRCYGEPTPTPTSAAPPKSTPTSTRPPAARPGTPPVADATPPAAAPPSSSRKTTVLAVGVGAAALLLWRALR